MLTPQELEKLCEQPESAILDFKRQFYDFDNSQNDKATATFIKDVCSMVNTVRDKTAYIIFGVETIVGQYPTLIGVNVDIDEAILQDKVKSKLHPRPDFKFYFIKIEDIKLGVLEIPVRKYSSPISAVVKMKGVEPVSFIIGRDQVILRHLVMMLFAYMNGCSRYHRTMPKQLGIKIYKV
jgi:predicted HTH transcriptional regulator